MKKILVLSFLLFGSRIYATTYYVSASGNDANSGTSAAAPWKTLSKVNATKFSPGDQVLFQRGNTFYGTLTISSSGTAASSIIFGAYGSGENPVITGFTTVSAWTSLGGNIWESASTVSSLSSCNMVAIKGGNTPMGRYPNTGYLTYQSHSGNTSITSSSLTGSPNWTGADVAVKANRFTVDRAKIASQSGGTLNFVAISSTPTNNFGFFIQNDARTLDAQNEWYYDPSTKKIRVYSIGMPADVKVASLNNVVSIPSTGTKYITLDGIDFTGSNSIGLNISGSYITIKNSHISFAGDDGIRLTGSYNNVLNNTLNDCTANGVFLYYGTPGYNTVKNNTVKRTGLIPGIEENAYSGAGIRCASANSLIQYNDIDSSGYCGILFRYNNIEVRNNFINHSCLVRDDGGGIYTAFTNETGKIIDGNIVLNTMGTSEGTSTAAAYTLAQGIYVDDGGTSVTITNNTVAYGKNSGIKIHNANNITVRNNTLYNNGVGTTSSSKGQIELVRNDLNYADIRNNVISNNILFCRTAEQLALMYASVLSLADTKLFGQADSNYYARPLNENGLINVQYSGNSWPGNSYNLGTWKAFTGLDANSKTSPKSITDVNDVRFEYNNTNSVKTISLDAVYIDVAGKSYSGSVTLQPYTSVVLMKNGSLPIPNTPPVANAGSDTTIYLPVNTIRLQGKGNDADGTVASYQWEMISGPSSYTIANPSSATTQVTGLTEGIYSFVLTVTDNQSATGKDTTKIYVVASKPPVASAGEDQSITLPVNNAQLHGSGSSINGSIAFYHWEMISGPSSYTIASPSSAATQVTGLAEGIYSFELTVTDDKGATAKDVMQIVVSKAANVAPVADAGNNQSITLPVSSVQLEGSGNDSDGSIVSYHWEMISGPSSYTIISPSSATTQVTGLAEGVYSFELTVTDDKGETSKSVVLITVNGAQNVAPVADAGSNQSITLPVNSIQLQGSGNDSDGSVVSYHWEMISGPSSYTIVSPSSAATQVTGLAEGIYSFELTVTDDKGGTGKDVVLITVNGAQDVAPVADAGSNQSVTLPVNSVQLEGSGTDADGSIVSYHWEMISGPSSYTIVSPSSATTQVTGLAEGIYSFELTVTDDEGETGKDVVQVVVNPAINISPVANAGSNQSITLPVNNVQLEGSGNDPDGSIVSYHWEMISGPSSYTIISPSSATTQVTGLAEGIYSFELTVTDDKGETDKDVVQIVVTAAPNTSPVADAGVNQSITLPVNSIRLEGNGTDSDGSIISYQWEMISGPSSYTIVSPSSATTQVTGLAEGIYSFELTVTDDEGETGKDVVQVVVTPAPNIPPVADAGVNQSITLPVNSIRLEGNGTDSDGSIISYQWEMISGPSSYTIVSPSSATTQITGLAEGIYTFELTVTDDRGAIAKDIIQVTVAPEENINVSPVADAGVNQSITLPVNSVQLQGNGTDSDGSIVSYQWKMISGPSSYNIEDPSLSGTQVTGLTEGIYSFEFTVTDDKGAIGKDVVQVVVSPAPNIAPVADAGTNITITLPSSQVSLSGKGTDADGTVVSYYWEKIAGPSGFNIESASSAATTVSGLQEGSYTFQLTVKDNKGAIGKSVVQVTVNATPNVAPVADAGTNITITLPSSQVSLSGKGTDVDGIVVSYYWEKIAGPSGFNIESASSAATTVSGLQEGSYTFQLTVKDNKGAIGKSVVQVTVNAAPNVAPVADAGTNITITLPSSQVSLSGKGTDADGTVVSYYWEKIAGPSGFNIESASSAATTVSGLQEGSYTFQLTVKDNKGAIGKSVVQVTVNAAPNVAPVANAGANITIALPVNTVTLKGAGTDADGTVVSYYWEKIAGPSGFNIESASSAATTVSGLQEGSYTFQLTVKDNKGAIGKSVMQVTVNAAPNVAPVADAGANITITLPANKVSLSGKGTDADGTVVSYYWEKIAGPSGFKIESASSAATTVSGLQEGSYTFQLTVKDNKGAVGKNVVQVTVNAAPNVAPVADAGANITITLPANKVSLSGKGTDADGTVVSYYWEKIAGPSGFKIESASSAATTVSGLQEGSYTFQLTVKDNKGAVGKSVIQVTVNAAPNIPPVANAGANITITLPVNTVTLKGAGTDADGTVVSYKWTKTSGPSAFNIVNPGLATTQVSGLAEGTYIFQLTVTDNKGAIGKSNVEVTVKQANSLPVANAGTNKTITLPVNIATLSGTGADQDGNIVSYKWEKISGPASFNIVNPSSPVTDIFNLTEGIYLIELTVKDNNGGIGKDTVQITVKKAQQNAPSQVNNLLPVVNAGNDTTVVYPVASLTLKGGASDPDGTIVSYRWQQVAGPAQATLSTPEAAATLISDLLEGTYTFELTATDNKGGAGKDSVNVIVASGRLAVDEITSVRLYPNPVRDITTLEVNGLKTEANLKIAVMDMNGRMVYSKEMTAGATQRTEKIDVSNFKSGAYVLILFADGNKINTLKFIKL